MRTLEHFMPLIMLIHNHFLDFRKKADSDWCGDTVYRRKGFFSSLHYP